MRSWPSPPPQTRSTGASARDQNDVPRRRRLPTAPVDRSAPVPTWATDVQERMHTMLRRLAAEIAMQCRARPTTNHAEPRNAILVVHDANRHAVVNAVGLIVVGLVRRAIEDGRGPASAADDRDHTYEAFINEALETIAIAQR